MPCAYSFAEYSEESTAPEVCVAQSLDEPTATVVPIAYSFELYSDVSTVLPVVVAHSLLAPLLDVFVTPVPPTAHALDE